MKFILMFGQKHGCVRVGLPVKSRVLAGCSCTLDKKGLSYACVNDSGSFTDKVFGKEAAQIWLNKNRCFQTL
jgi:hypothetical protein